MKSTNPIEIDGQIFDRYSLNLAINGKYLADGTPDASIAARFIPTRIEGGNIYTADENYIPMLIGSISESQDNDVRECGKKIKAAIQQLVNLKGL